MRQVEFKPAENCETEASWVKKKGFFHGFFQTTDFNRFGADHKVFAIVEDETGQVHQLGPNEIKFIDLPISVRLKNLFK